MPITQKPTYEWYQITTFIRRDASGVIRLVVCLDCPDLKGFEKTLGLSALEGSGLIYVALVDHIINLYDNSVWKLRDWVRIAEKVSVKGAIFT